MKKNRIRMKAFTLAETIIVVAVIGVMAAVSVPVFESYVDRSDEKVVLTDAKNYLAGAETVTKEYFSLRGTPGMNDLSGLVSEINAKCEKLNGERTVFENDNHKSGYEVKELVIDKENYRISRMTLVNRKSEDQIIYSADKDDAVLSESNGKVFGNFVLLSHAKSTSSPVSGKTMEISWKKPEDNMPAVTKTYKPYIPPVTTAETTVPVTTVTEAVTSAETAPVTTVISPAVTTEAPVVTENVPEEYSEIAKQSRMMGSSGIEYMSLESKTGGKFELNKWYKFSDLGYNGKLFTGFGVTFSGNSENAALECMTGVYSIYNGAPECRFRDTIYLESGNYYELLLNPRNFQTYPEYIRFNCYYQKGSDLQIEDVFLYFEEDEVFRPEDGSDELTLSRGTKNGSEVNTAIILENEKKPKSVTLVFSDYTNGRSGNMVIGYSTYSFSMNRSHGKTITIDISEPSDTFIDVYIYHGEKDLCGIYLNYE